MKCGTTTLATELDLHPEVCFARDKETDFFLREDWRDHISDYLAFFENPEGKLLGEGSPSYTKLPAGTPSRLAGDLYEYNPKMKLIYMMRDPMSRLVSHYKHNQRSHELKESFAEVVSTDPHYVNVGRYAYQLKPFLERFPEKQLLLITMDELANDRDAFLKKVADFLGIDPEKFAPTKIHQGDSSRKNNEKVDKVIASGFGQTMRKLVPVRHRYYVKSKFQKAFSKSAEQGEYDLPQEVVTELKKVYDAEITAIEELMGRSLEDWKIQG